MDIFRTLLFIPGNRPSMLEKAVTLPADALIPDLEDSVPPHEKANAREVVKGSIPALAKAGKPIFVRVNSLSSGLIRDDLEAIVAQGIRGISVGKVESAHDIFDISNILAHLEKERGLPIGSIKLIPWLETARGIMRAYEIASANPRLVAVAFGAEDFTADMGISRTEGGLELLYARSKVAIAARTAEIYAYDTPAVEYKDEAVFVRDAQQGRQLGYQGKFAIHPNQLGPFNRVFSPTPEEVAYARRVVAAFEEAEKQGSAATSLDGKMIDTPVAKRARKLLELAEVIEGWGAGG
jgi:citrate lyase subunit beta/citryl-CoA lyase